MIENRVVDRSTGNIFIEKTFGESFIEWSYLTAIGRAITGNPLIQKFVSAITGAWMQSAFSQVRITTFINEFEIKMSDFIEPDDGFTSFNDFFVRKLRPGARSFPTATTDLGSPAEGRVSLYSLASGETPLYFKGHALPLVEVLGDNHALVDQLLGGWAYVIRLCPTDYHRFHFADSGIAHPAKRIGGLLHSVNPLSLTLNPRAFVENERQLTLQDSENFGTLAYLEVGALCVGRIQQCFEAGTRMHRGAEKGYFEFGGSTQILFCGPELIPSPDLVKNSHNGLETLVRLGETLASLKR
ncbi:MAG: phosphatidylserine decarboxylase [Bdellovibrionota bacterium]